MGGTEVVAGYSGSDRVSNDDRSGYGDIKGGGTDMETDIEIAATSLYLCEESVQ